MLPLLLLSVTLQKERAPDGSMLNERQTDVA